MLDPYPFRARNLIERFFNKIKERRRVATRNGKLGVRQTRINSNRATR